MKMHSNQPSYVRMSCATNFYNLTSRYVMLTSLCLIKSGSHCTKNTIDVKRNSKYFKIYLNEIDYYERKKNESY